MDKQETNETVETVETVETPVTEESEGENQNDLGEKQLPDSLAMRILRRNGEPAIIAGKVVYPPQTIIEKVSLAQANDTVFMSTSFASEKLSLMNEILSSKGLTVAALRQECASGDIRSFITEINDADTLLE